MRDDYIKKLNLYADAGVRDYWIVNPQKESIVVYSLENNFAPTLSNFTDQIKANIFETLAVDFGEIESAPESRASHKA